MKVFHIYYWNSGMDYFCYVTCSPFKYINRAISLYTKKRNHILTKAIKVLNTQWKMFFCVDILNMYSKINCSYMQFVYNLNSSYCPSIMLPFLDSMCYLFCQKSLESCFGRTCCDILEEHSTSWKVLRKEHDQGN